MLQTRDLRGSSQKVSSLTEVFEVTRLLTFAAVKNVSIAVWRGTPTASALERIDHHLSKLARKYPKLASAIVLESMEFRAPEQEARAEHARLTNKFEKVSLGVAMIVDGNSAKHSVYRFVLTTVQLMSAPTVTQKIFQSTGAAAGWLVICDPELDKAQLVDAIKEARALTV